MQKKRQGYWLGELVGTVGGWLNTAADAADRYAPLIKTGTAALSTYASYKDQQKKNDMQQAAYDDYMAQAAAAGHEAAAAVDLNLTPMTVSGVPTTKADVTDFTAVAAKGGLMSIPNRQRKRYARGPGEDEIMEFDEESITPFGLQQETGIDLTGEQVKYNTGNSREGAWNVWNSGAINQEIYEFDFEIFFDSGDWMDMLKGEAPATGNMQMASGPDVSDSRNELSLQLFGKELRLLTEEEMNILEDEVQHIMMATGGIAGLRNGGRIGYEMGGTHTAWGQDKAFRIWNILPDDIQAQYGNFSNFFDTDDWHGVNMAKGGRPGYKFGDVIIEDQEAILKTPNKEIVTNDMEEIQGQTAGGGARGWKAQEIAMDWAWDRYGKEFYDLSHEIQMSLYGEALDLVDSGGNAKGGLPKRVRKAPGGIMNLGGLEKDYRTTGGFVPIGAYEKKDDVPARLSKNEFVMTADAVRAAGGGSINKGAQRMYDTMKHLEAQPTAKRMTA